VQKRKRGCRTEVRPQGLLGGPVRDPECGDTRHLGRKRAVMPSSLPHCRVDDKMSSTMRAQPAPSIHGETLNEVREGPAPRSMSRRRVVEEAGTQRVDLTPQSNGYVPVLPKGRFKPDWNQLFGVHEGEVIETSASSGSGARGLALQAASAAWFSAQLVQTSNGYVPVLPKGSSKPDWDQLLGVQRGETLAASTGGGTRDNSQNAPPAAHRPTTEIGASFSRLESVCRPCGEQERRDDDESCALRAEWVVASSPVKPTLDQVRRVIKDPADLSRGPDINEQDIAIEAEINLQMDGELKNQEDPPAVEYEEADLDLSASDCGGSDASDSDESTPHTFGSTTKQLFADSQPRAKKTKGKTGSFADNMEMHRVQAKTGHADFTCNCSIAKSHGTSSCLKVFTLLQLEAIHADVSKPRSTRDENLVVSEHRSLPPSHTHAHTHARTRTRAHTHTPLKTGVTCTSRSTGLTSQSLRTLRSPRSST